MAGQQLSPRESCGAAINTPKIAPGKTAVQKTRQAPELLPAASKRW